MLGAAAPLRFGLKIKHPAQKTQGLSSLAVLKEVLVATIAAG